ncbi:uncharacterized protein ACBR49_012659 [Aulostomus maculatus]
MKMPVGVVRCFLALLLAIKSVTAFKKLNSIKDLEELNFAESVPKHSLVLLHWFANTIDIDNNNNILLTFDPETQDYGSHHYGNYERLFNPRYRGNNRFQYYTVGNLNRDRFNQLPSYVVRPPTGYRGHNRDRIIFRVRERNTGHQSLQIIDEVFLTQHFEASHEGNRYDPAHTYQVTTNLLQQIREFAVGETQTNTLQELREDFGCDYADIDDWQLKSLEIKWGDLACLVLFLCIVEKYSSNLLNKPQTAARRNTQQDFTCNIPEDRNNHVGIEFSLQECLLPDQIKLEVGTGTNGKARIRWQNVPLYLRKEGTVMVVLFKNNKDQESRFSQVIKNESGSCNTSVLLSEGLQARLHKARTWYCLCTVVGEEIGRGNEFHSPDIVKITGYNARLQLFVKDGKACARLYVSKSFTEWKSEFNMSWVGFYASEDKTTNDYDWWQWQWATKFTPSAHFDNVYHVYEYHSGMTIAPGIQARFILRDDIVKAHTPSWR